MILPKNFDEVVRFAALERYMRGPGDRNQYDYSVHDVMCVAMAHDKSTIVCDSTIKALTPRKQAVNLHQAWIRHTQRTQAS